MTDFIRQRSFELSYALFQLARLVKQKDLRSRIEANAIYLLESAEGGDVASLGKGIAVLKKLIILGEGIGEIGYDHSKVINKQFAYLNTAIAEYTAMRQKSEEKDADVNLESIFRDGVKLPIHSPSLEKSSDNNSGNSFVSDGSSLNYKSNGNTAIQTSQSSLTRQTAIIETIRQCGNEFGCRLKDVIAAFPHVSERTLRYDLQRVCEQGMVERVGNGGPFSYYRIKQGVPSMAPAESLPAGRQGVTN